MRGWLRVVGDLTALYDLSSPSLLDGCDGFGRVLVVVNNGGGRIFERLPRVVGMEESARDVVTNAHGFSFEGWAAMWGMEYMRADTADEIEVEGGEVPIILEVCPDAGQTKAFWKAFDALEEVKG